MEIHNMPCAREKDQGQSAYYTLQTGKKVGIVLILETAKDGKYWIPLNTTIEHLNLPVDIWSIGNTAYWRPIKF